MSSHETQTDVEYNCPVGLFGCLPAELLEPIYVLSENLDLPFVNRHFYNALSSNYVRIKLSSSVFYYSRRRENFYSRNHLSLASLQMQVMRCKWFTNILAKKVECEVVRLQGGKEHANRFQDGIRIHRLPPKSKVQVASATTLPKEMLRGPWSRDKVKLCHRLLRWNVKGNKREDCSQGLTEAIKQQNVPAVKLLLDKLRLTFNPHLFTEEILLDCDIRIIETMLTANAMTGRPFRSPDDEKDPYFDPNDLPTTTDPQAVWLYELLQSRVKSFHEQKSTDAKAGR